MKLRHRAAPWILVGLYWVVLATLAGEITASHLMYGGSVLLLAHLGRLGTRALLFLLPFILTGVIYDSQRYWGEAVRGTPHVAGPYLLERSLFGIPSADGPLTLNEWFGLHLHPVLDLISGASYLVFVGVFMFVAAYLTRRIYRHVGTDWTPERRAWTTRALVWSFLVVNVLGYATWFLYPTAPPWYVEAYGLDTILLDVPGNPARAVRFDHLVGTDLFATMYGYESNAFGAIPSLHIAYPMISVFFGFRLRALRVFTVAFLGLMCFSAIYLNHHYVIDVILGGFYGLAAAAITLVAAEWIAERTA